MSSPDMKRFTTVLQKIGFLRILSRPNFVLITGKWTNQEPSPGMGKVTSPIKMQGSPVPGGRISVLKEKVDNRVT
jgi:hypothetical protein